MARYFCLPSVLALSLCSQSAALLTPLQFINQVKSSYLADVRALNGGRWIVTMGNEAGDLDTIASSFTLSWLQSQVNNKTAVPLVQVASNDFFLRKENGYALSLAGISTPGSQLLTITDTSAFSPFPSTAFALTDHNVLGASFSSHPTTANVTAVVDHHDDEGLYPTANPRIVQTIGSCSSLVAQLLPTATGAIHPQLATLLMTAILIDTNDLKAGGDGTVLDTQALAFLVPRSTYASQISSSLFAKLQSTSASTDWVALANDIHDDNTLNDLTDTLKGLRDDVSGLSGRDILRRDYKEYVFTLPWAGGRQIKAGISAMPISLQDLEAVPNGGLEDFMGEWLLERGLAVLGATTHYENSSGEEKREQAWVVIDPTGSAVDVNELAWRLWDGLEANWEWDLTIHNEVDLDTSKLPPGALGQVYRQGNVDISRKAIAPALQEILESP